MAQCRRVVSVFELTPKRRGSVVSVLTKPVDVGPGYFNDEATRAALARVVLRYAREDADAMSNAEALDNVIFDRIGVWHSPAIDVYVAAVRDLQLEGWKLPLNLSELSVAELQMAAAQAQPRPENRNDALSKLAALRQQNSQKPLYEFQRLDVPIYGTGMIFFVDCSSEQLVDTSHNLEALKDLVNKCQQK